MAKLEFDSYKYKEALYPRLCVRQAFDALKHASPANGHKYYLQLLKLAKLYSEERVALAIELLLECQQCPHPDKVTSLIKEKPIDTPNIHIKQPDLSVYDQLRQQSEVIH